MDEARSKVRTALQEAILSLCNNALDYTMELSIEGLLGITVDKQDVFLVNVNEVVRSAEYEDLLAEPTSSPPTEEKVGYGLFTPSVSESGRWTVYVYDTIHMK